MPFATSAGSAAFLSSLRQERAAVLDLYDRCRRQRDPLAGGLEFGEAYAGLGPQTGRHSFLAGGGWSTGPAVGGALSLSMPRRSVSAQSPEPAPTPYRVEHRRQPATRDDHSGDDDDPERTHAADFAAHRGPDRRPPQTSVFDMPLPADHSASRLSASFVAAAPHLPHAPPSIRVTAQSTDRMAQESTGPGGPSPSPSFSANHQDGTHPGKGRWSSVRSPQTTARTTAGPHGPAARPGGPSESRARSRQPTAAAPPASRAVPSVSACVCAVCGSSVPWLVPLSLGSITVSPPNPAGPLLVHTARCIARRRLVEARAPILNVVHDTDAVEAAVTELHRALLQNLRRHQWLQHAARAGLTGQSRPGDGAGPSSRPLNAQEGSQAAATAAAVVAEYNHIARSSAAAFALRCPMERCQGPCAYGDAHAVQWWPTNEAEAQRTQPAASKASAFAQLERKAVPPVTILHYFDPSALGICAAIDAASVSQRPDAAATTAVPPSGGDDEACMAAVGAHAAACWTFVVRASRSGEARTLHIPYAALTSNRVPHSGRVLLVADLLAAVRLATGWEAAVPTVLAAAVGAAKEMLPVAEQLARAASSRAGSVLFDSGEYRFSRSASVFSVDTAGGDDEASQGRRLLREALRRHQQRSEPIAHSTPLLALPSLHLNVDFDQQKRHQHSAQ